jgi:DNA/RNA-binding protein KIN17
MPKNDFLSPKAIANRMKAKGLQKLRWYCQLCNKQCRDENGFKCHQTSEGHKRLMLVFGENPNKFIEGYSEMFENHFLEQLKINHPYSRVLANEFYQGVIKDKHHIHMNSTKWLTLTDFIKHLGRSGSCMVEENERGWYITLIRQPRIFEDHAKIEKERNSSEMERKKIREFTEKIEQAEINENSSTVDHSSNDSFIKYNNEACQPIRFQLRQTSENHSSNDSHMETIPKEKIYRIENTFNKEPWLAKGIVVKVISEFFKKNGYFRKKGVILEVKDLYIAVLEMLDTGDILSVNQNELETVLPSPGSVVTVLRGKSRGSLAVLIEICLDKQILLHLK